VEHDLILIGLGGMIDPPRKEVKGLIQTCKESGVRIVMITGDHLATAKAIASEIGIDGGAITGAELENLNEEEFTKKAEGISVYARVNPGHKLKIVDALKNHGHLVAMTGDGVNDAPAIKRADIGIAMGISGTDVAKEASDMVLLDDRFGTIVSAIEEGRGIFDNIRKFVDYLLSCNIAEVLIVFLAVIIFKDVPLTAVMLLWINIVTDGLPAIALGLDPAEKGILKHSPKKFQTEIINKKVWAEIVLFSIAMTGVLLTLFALNLDEGLREARATAFMAIIIYELVRLANIRSDYKIAWNANLWLPVGIASSILLQLLIVYTPFLANLFELSPIDLSDWLYILVTAGLLFVVFRFVDGLLDKVTFLSDHTENSRQVTS
jgi:Ca2+-transporting ATPase